MKQTQGRFLLQPDKDFPLDCETLETLQTNTHVVSIIGNLAGDRAVLIGCEEIDSGTRRAPGYLFVRTVDHPEGEVLYWEGGAVASGMYLRQEPVAVEAQGYNYPQAYVERSLAPGVGEENYRWEEFHEARSLPELEAELEALRTALQAVRPTPLGMVEAWAGTGVPDGYLLCEGQQLLQSEYPALYAVLGEAFNQGVDCNGRRLTTTEGFFRLPDLRSRFVVGHNPLDDDYNEVGAAGGEKTHRLTVGEMPSHAHGQNLWAGASGRWKGGGDQSWPDATSHHDRTTPFGTTDRTGSGTAHENRPPYYALAYVMRVR